MSVTKKYYENEQKNALKKQLFDKIFFGQYSKQNIALFAECINSKLTTNSKYSKYDDVKDNMFSNCTNSPNVSYGESPCYTTQSGGLGTTLNAGTQGPKLF